MKYIVSKSSQGIEFGDWKTTTGGINRLVRSVLIKGGAFVADKKTLEAVKGVVNEVSDEDYEWLKDNPTFKQMVDDGYIVVFEKEGPANKEADKGDMKDNSAQLTPEDFEAAGKEPPIVGAEDGKKSRKKKK